jgi:hypothetical protein
MKSFFAGLLAIATALALGGCAHPITITPDLAKLPTESSQAKIDKAVGYYISEQNRALKVVTPAGGGDKVEYAPYADLESGLYRVLYNTFSAAYPVKYLQDQAFLKSKNIAWVFTPTITTNSSSRNSFFWPPTDFSVTIDVVSTDAAQQPVWKETIKADNDVIAVKDTLKEHGLAGRVAAEKALKMLQEKIQAAPEFRK